VNDIINGRSDNESCSLIVDQIFSDNVLPPTHGYVVLHSLIIIIIIIIITQVNVYSAVILT